MGSSYQSRATVALATVLLAITRLYAQKLSLGADLDAAKTLVVMIDGDFNGEHTQGAGIVFAVNGGWTYIATAYHVVRKGDVRASNLKVRFFQQPLEALSAEHYDDAKRELDVAVLRVKIDRLSFPFARVANVDTLEQSELVYAIGHPTGEDRWDVIYQPGSISKIGSLVLDVQDAYIKSGHSGGVLIDEQEMLVGMLLNTDGTKAEALRLDQLLLILRRDLDLPVQLIRAHGENVRLQAKPDSSVADLQPRPNILVRPMVPWLTRSADNSRSGWNPHETQLTQTTIASKGFLRTTIVPVVGDARGMETQPLILPNVNTASGIRDVMVLPSMADVISGVDARDGSGIWQVTLGMPITGSTAIDSHVINDHWGCLSTGVIDSDLQRLYQVCWVSPDKTGNPQTARYYMFVLNLADGSQVVPPIEIQGTSGGQNFNSEMRKQRSSLLETTVNGVKTVFGCSGTTYESKVGAAGFCFAFDVASNKLAAMLATTAGAGAGIWMAGQGPAADSQGNLYLVTGNGEFDGKSQWGESLLKLKYTPASGGSPAALAVVDHWTPWTDLARAGQKMASLANTAAGFSGSSEADKQPTNGGINNSLKNARVVGTINDQGEAVPLVFPEMSSGGWQNAEWGSAGPACIFSIAVCIAAGKDGIAYPIKTASLGATTLVDLASPKANCAKLAAPPTWLTMNPGPVDPCPSDPRQLDFFPWGDTAGLYMTPVQFFDPIMSSWTIFVWGANSQLHKWAVSSTGMLSFVAKSKEFASADARGNPPGGMPGGFCSGSSNGADPNSAILVCTIPYGDANAHVVNGRLLVYDAVHLAADGSLQVLWDSQQSAVQFLFNKFNPPVIDGGQLYIPNYNGSVDVYRSTQ